MIEINIKLEENTQTSEFAKSIGLAIEEYLIKIMNSTLERTKILESKIINYYTLTKDENYKDYFDIRELHKEEVNEIKEEVKEEVKEENEGKIINIKSNANKTKKTK